MYFQKQQELELRNSNKKVTLEVPVDENQRCSTPQRQIVPRTHSNRNISRAKIKTVKLTVAVIATYILCSAPFICAQIMLPFKILPDEIGKCWPRNTVACRKTGLFGSLCGDTITNGNYIP